MSTVHGVSTCRNTMRISRAELPQKRRVFVKASCVIRRERFSCVRDSRETPSEMDFRNSTELDSSTLHAMFLRHTSPYRHEKLTVRVRYGRGADFSGRCFYRDGRIFI